MSHVSPVFWDFWDFDSKLQWCPQISKTNIADAFAKFFHDKVQANSSKATIKDSVYNCKCKIKPQNILIYLYES